MLSNRLYREIGLQTCHVLNYETLRTKPKVLFALTGLARREFDELLPVFATGLRRLKPDATQDARSASERRVVVANPACGQRKTSYYFLVYTKTYPLQVVQGQLFGMSQSSASEWI